MKHVLSILLFLIFINPSSSQDLTGKWTGILLQTGKTDTFTYQLNLKQQDKEINGIAFSKFKGDSVVGKFHLLGVFEGETLVIQEVEQTAPKDMKWCLKQLRLKWHKKDGKEYLSGNWEASGCTLGEMSLQKNVQYIDNENVKDETMEEALLGKWIGHLSQSDRSYGFYFEINFEKNREGISYIVSEGNGGHAFHKLNWDFDPAKKLVNFEESEISDKSDSKWRWCIKSGALSFSKSENAYFLKGDWWGFIEGYDKKSGACAPGKLHLEKAILKKEKIMVAEPFENYEMDEGRVVKVGRVLEVQNDQLKIKVWDNGTVDGDVLSLFLNGKQLLNNFRVTKHKYTILVTLDRKTNFLILHAVDLGNVIPNTVAVSVDDGKKEQIVIVSSNLRESGAVMVKQFSVED